MFLKEKKYTPTKNCVNVAKLQREDHLENPRTEGCHYEKKPKFFPVSFCPSPLPK